MYVHATLRGISCWGRTLEILVWWKIHHAHFVDEEKKPLYICSTEVILTWLKGSRNLGQHQVKTEENPNLEVTQILNYLADLVLAWNKVWRGVDLDRSSCEFYPNFTIKYEGGGGHQISHAGSSVRRREAYHVVFVFSRNSVCLYQTRFGV